MRNGRRPQGAHTGSMVGLWHLSVEFCSRQHCQCPQTATIAAGDDGINDAAGDNGVEGAADAASPEVIQASRCGPEAREHTKYLTILMALWSSSKPPCSFMSHRMPQRLARQPDPRSSSSGCSGKPTHTLAQLQVLSNGRSRQQEPADLLTRERHDAATVSLALPQYGCISAAEDLLKARDSSIKRNNALLKRLRALSEDTKQAALADIQKVNQSRVRPGPCAVCQHCCAAVVGHWTDC